MHQEHHQQPTSKITIIINNELFKKTLLSVSTALGFLAFDVGPTAYRLMIFKKLPQIYIPVVFHIYDSTLAFLVFAWVTMVCTFFCNTIQPIFVKSSWFHIPLQFFVTEMAFHLLRALKQVLTLNT